MRNVHLIGSCVSALVSAAAWVGTCGLPFETPITPETADAQCSSNPDAFFNRVRLRVEQDLQTMKNSRSDLRASSADVENKRSEIMEKQDYAVSAAADFRKAWQAGVFPVMIHGRAYTRPDVEAQTSSLLAQIDSYTQSLAKYTHTLTNIRDHIEDLTSRIVTTETDLGLLDSRCSVYKATQSESAATDLMASVDALFAENATVISASPIRSVDEMMRDTTCATPVSRSRTVSFLTGE